MNAYDVKTWMLMRKCFLAMLMPVILMLILMLLNLNTCYADTEADLWIRIMSLWCTTNKQTHKKKYYNRIRNLIIHSNTWFFLHCKYDLPTITLWSRPILFTSMGTMPINSVTHIVFSTVTTVAATVTVVVVRYTIWNYREDGV